jgi:hypothetical protein
MSAQKELPGLAVESVPQATLEKAALVMQLLPCVTSLSVVSEFLKSKGVPHSAGSWEEMHEKRIVPSLHSKKITLPELIHLLGEAEEFGRCHVFLYSAKKNDVEKCMRQDHIHSLCHTRKPFQPHPPPAHPDHISRSRTSRRGRAACSVWWMAATGAARTGIRRRDARVSGWLVPGGKAALT